MAKFEVTAPDGRVVEVEGPSMPTEAELTDIFAALPPRQASFSGRGGASASIAEPALAMLSGAVAEPVAGLAGIASGLLDGSEEASDTVEAVRSALTYEPRSEEGKKALENLATFLEPLSVAIGALEEGAGEVGFRLAGPVGGAVTRAVPAGIMEALGLKGLRRVRGATKVTGISDDVAKMAARNGIDIDDPANLPKLQALTAQEAAEQARRAGLFRDLEIPTTRSRVTQAQGDFLQERTLARDPTAGGAIQERLIQEATGFRNAALRLQNDLGIPDEAGDAIKEALETRVTGLRSAKNAAYTELAQLSAGKGMPIAGDAVLAALKDEKVAGMAGRLDTAARTRVNDLMVEYGLDTEPGRIDDWVKRRQDAGGALPTKAAVTPLSVLNAEDFRQALNDLIDPMGSKELNGVAGALKSGLDSELLHVDEALAIAQASGDIGALGRNTRDVLAAAKRARELVSEMKGEFSPKALAGKLTASQKGTFDRDLIASSEVTKKILSGTDAGSLENVTELMESLGKSGASGAKAIGDLQAATVLDLMEHATVARSAKLAEGVTEWSGTAFGKRFDQIGSKKLRRIFQNNPKALDMLENLKAAGDLRTSLASVAKASGTADDLVNFFRNAGIIRQVVGLGGGAMRLVIGEGMESATKRIQAAGARRAAQKQLHAQPDAQQQLQQVKRLYPNMAVALGIGGLYASEETTK